MTAAILDISGIVACSLHLNQVATIVLNAIGINVNDIILKYGTPAAIVLTSSVYIPRIFPAKNRQANIKIPARAIPNTLLTVKPLHDSFSSPAPINCDIRIPATVPIAPITTEKISIKLPHKPTAAILFLPS